MKYYKDSVSQLKINITTPMRRVSKFACHLIMIFYFIISFSKQFKLLSFFVVMTRFNKNYTVILYNNCIIITILLKNCFNKLFDRLLSCVKDDCLAKSREYTQLYKQNYKEYVLDIFWYKRHYCLYRHSETLLKQIQNEHKLQTARLIA